MDELDYKYEREITCPYCGWKDHDPWLRKFCEVVWPRFVEGCKADPELANDAPRYTKAG